MPLVLTCSEYVERNLFVLPYYGHGWKREDAGAPEATRLDILGPEPFHIRVGECIYCDGHLVGVSGTIHEPSHPLETYWCYCLLRNTDDSDFTEHVGQYMIWISKTPLIISPGSYPEKALYEWVTPNRSAYCSCGYGAVAESVEMMRGLFERTMNSRKLVKMEDQS